MIPEDYFEVISRLSARDASFQSLLRDREEREADFARICEGLSPEDRELLELYVSACEAVISRQSQLAATHYAVSGADVFKSTRLVF